VSAQYKIAFLIRLFFVLMFFANLIVLFEAIS
jgi:hypothetical protein